MPTKNPRIQQLIRLVQNFTFLERLFTCPFLLPGVYAFSTDNCAKEAHTMKADLFVIGQKLLVALASLGLLLLAAGAAAQQAPKPNAYPEHGQVVATRLGAEAVGSAGIVGSLKRWIYRVDCGELYYDLQGGGKPSLTVGQNVTFRIEKQKAYLDDGKNGKRYNIVGTGKSDQKESPQPN